MLVGFLFRFWVLNCLEFRFPSRSIGSSARCSDRNLMLVSRYKLDVIVASNDENQVHVTKTAENIFSEEVLILFYPIYWC